MQRNALRDSYMAENQHSTVWQWLASLYFIGAATAALSGPVSLGIVIPAVIGLILFAPPLRRLTMSRYNFAMSGKLPMIAVFLALALGTIPRNEESTQFDANAEKVRKEAAEAEGKRNDFVANKATILTKVQGLVNDKQFGEARALGESYWNVSKDVELRAILDSAVKGQMLSRLDAGGLSTFDKATVYETLAKLEPENQRYQKEAKRFGTLRDAEEKKLAAKRAKEAQLAARRAMLEKQFSSWDGSHPAVEAVVKRLMKNPDSYDHVETRYVDLGKSMRVIMTYRGTNSFGGVVPSTVAATVNDAGQVLSLDTAR